MMDQRGLDQSEDIRRRNELLAAYQTYPTLLEDDVVQALAELRNDEDRIVHNVAVRRIVRLIPTEEMQRALWRNITQAILQTVEHQFQGVQDDGEKQDT